MAIAAACILWFSIIMYSVFGGADYGAGFWDLLAGGSKRGERPRRLIHHAMPPRCGANHVWRIFGVLISACIPATFLIADANRYYDDVMAGCFRTRAFVIGILAGLAAVVGLFVLRDDSPYNHHGLAPEGLPFVIASAVFGLTALGALWRQLRRARVRTLPPATAGSGALRWGGRAYPYILPHTVAH